MSEIGSRQPTGPLTIDIHYDLNEPKKTVIKTDIKKEMLDEVLGDYIRSQMGKGRDARPALPKSKYRITLRLDLSNDQFSTTSDTGNSALTLGFVAHICQILRFLKVEDL